LTLGELQTEDGRVREVTKVRLKGYAKRKKNGIVGGSLTVFATDLSHRNLETTWGMRGNFDSGSRLLLGKSGDGQGEEG